MVRGYEDMEARRSEAEPAKLLLVGFCAVAFWIARLRGVSSICLLGGGFRAEAEESFSWWLAIAMPQLRLCSPQGTRPLPELSGFGLLPDRLPSGPGLRTELRSQANLGVQRFRV